MNAFRLISWLRRRSWRRENHLAAPRQSRIHAPELLEPRTVLSSMPFFAADSGESALDRRENYGGNSPGLAASGLAAYVLHIESEMRSFDQLVLPLPLLNNLGLDPQPGSYMTSPAPWESTGSAIGTNDDTQAASLAPEMSAQMTTLFAASSNSFSFRSPWLSSTSPSGSPSSGLSSPDAVGSASDAEDEQSPGAFGRTLVAAIAPSQLPISSFIIMGDGWWWSVSLQSYSPDRGSQSNSAASESRDAAPNYGRTGPSGNLLADELTTHLAHAEEPQTARPTTSLIASPLATTNTALSEASRRAASEADDRLADSARQLGRDDLGGDGESDGMISIDGGGALHRGRKLSASPAMQAQAVNPRLARLTDISLLRDSPPLVRDLVRIARDALFAGAVSPAGSLEAGPPEHADDPMLDILAADVGTLRQSTAAASADIPAPAASPSLSLEAGVALYQAFDVASEEAAAGRADPGNTAGPNSAAEQDQ